MNFIVFAFSVARRKEKKGTTEHDPKRYSDPKERRHRRCSFCFQSHLLDLWHDHNLIDATHETVQDGWSAFLFCSISSPTVLNSQCLECAFSTINSNAPANFGLFHYRVCALNFKFGLTLIGLLIAMFVFFCTSPVRSGVSRANTFTF